MEKLEKMRKKFWHAGPKSKNLLVPRFQIFTQLVRIHVCGTQHAQKKIRLHGGNDHSSSLRPVIEYNALPVPRVTDSLCTDASNAVPVPVH